MTLQESDSADLALYIAIALEQEEPRGIRLSKHGFDGAEGDVVWNVRRDDMIEYLRSLPEDARLCGVVHLPEGEPAPTVEVIPVYASRDAHDLQPIGDEDPALMCTACYQCPCCTGLSEDCDPG